MTSPDPHRPAGGRLPRARLPPRPWRLELLCLVVVALTLWLAICCYRCSRVNAQVQATIGEVSMIIGGARQDYGQYGYSGLTTAVAVGSRVIPDLRVDGGGTTATNGYAGAITIVDNSARMAGTARLSYAQVPATQCAQIVAAVQPLTREIDVQGAPVTQPDGTLDGGRLDARCAAAAGVKIDFVFGRK